VTKKKEDKQFKMIEEGSPAVVPRLFLTLKPEARLKKIKKEKIKKGGKLRNVLVGLFLGLGILFWSFYSRAETLKIPHLINYQSVVLDAGGEPLPDGLHEIEFRLQNAAGEELYFEKQTLPSHKGVVSAMIGGGGELSPEILAPKTPLFLGVSVSGVAAQPLLEIVPVPYSLYAEEALGVAPNSIETEDIAAKAITIDLLAEDVIDQISSKILSPNFSSGLIYSRGGSIKNVLKDYDVALHQRQVNLDQQKIDFENKTNTLDQKIDNEVSGLQTQVNEKASVIYVNNAVTQAVSNIAVPPTPPLEIVAAGIVTLSGLSASLSFAHNTSQAMTAQEAPGRGKNFAGSADSIGVFFNSPVAKPYVVQVTPAFTSQASGIIYVRETQNNFFVIDHPLGTVMSPFHFLIYK